MHGARVTCTNLRQQLSTSPYCSHRDEMTPTGTLTAARPSVMQFPSAFDTVAGTSFTVQSCSASSEQSSMNSVCDAVPGVTPRADTHQSPTVSCVGTPEPSTGKLAVKSVELPAPAKAATSSAPEKPPWGAKTREESV